MIQFSFLLRPLLSLRPSASFPLATVVIQAIPWFALFLSFSPAARVLASEPKLTVDIETPSNTSEAADAITVVGVVQRWDVDGNPRRLPDPKAKIDAPHLDATAVRAEGNRWVFQDLPKGKYDIVILGKPRLRIEGFSYAPVNEFDPFLSADAMLEEDVREIIVDEIKKSKHYENIVEPLYLAGDEKVARVLVMLLRDQPTSYEAEAPGAATLRHEIWQFTQRHGGWQKEKRTKVLDRVLMPRDELHQWTWLWDPKLGGIVVQDAPVALKYSFPKLPGSKKLQGLYP
jgi:hypothetical protein